jgi:hypothetical protein
MFEQVLVFELTLITEPEWTTDMQVDLFTIGPSSRTEPKVNSGSFFILGHMSGGHVTVSDGDCRILHNFEHVIPQQLYQLWKVQSTCSLSPWIVPMSCLCPVMQQPSSKEWHSLLAYDSSDLRDCRQARYQVSYPASLITGLIILGDHNSKRRQLNNFSKCFFKTPVLRRHHNQISVPWMNHWCTNQLGHAAPNSLTIKYVCNFYGNDS